jgi:2-polyprenyl-3-methyl-5-hydroxy-6-metoxy-1,4-benzoquinol methylase
MKEFWNERYAEEAYAYGQEANDFIKAQQIGTGLKVLCLAEGEGRNAVYIASLGNDVTCIDYSQEGLQKTARLAQMNGVQVTGICQDLSQTQLQQEHWDLIIGVFAHFPPHVKEHIWPQVFAALKPGGQLLMEVYDQEQLRFGTGGPQHLDLLYGKEELEALLTKQFNSIQIEKIYRDVHEGVYHNGAAATLQVRALK